MRTMVLEYAQQHLPLPKIAQLCRFIYTSTMVSIWDILIYVPHHSYRFSEWSIYGAAGLQKKTRRGLVTEILSP